MTTMFIVCEGCKQTAGCSVNGRCFGESARSMSVRSEGTRIEIAKENQFGKDAGAYRRLRADGVQPRNIDGAARMELHSERHQVEQRPDPATVAKFVDASGDTTWAKGTELEGAT